MLRIKKIQFLRLIAIIICIQFRYVCSGQTVVTNPASPWTVPAGVSSVQVLCWGGGGGGGGAHVNAAATCGGGGGGGAFASSTIAVTAGQTYTITYGAGGTGGSSASSGSGQNGGATTFTGAGGTVTAAGGTGGTGGNGANEAGGAGGTTAASTGTTKYAGGTGVTSNYVTYNIGGAGGGGAGNNGAGSPTTATTAPVNGPSNGGTGGSGTSAPYAGGTGGTFSGIMVYSGQGGGGAVPGGGGAGSAANTSGTSYTGGAGAAGQVILIYTVVPSTLTLGSDNPAAASQCAGNASVIIQGFSVAVSGGTGSLTDISFISTGTYAAADLLDFNLYYTTTNVFATTNLLATIAAPAAAGTQTFPVFATPTLTNGSTYYLWITTDVAATVTDGHTIAVNGITTGNLTGGSTMAGGPTTAGGTQTLKAAPSSNAGSNQVNCNNSTFTLAGNNPSGGSGAWTCTSGCGGVSITTPAAYNSTVTGVAIGTATTLMWTITNAPCTSSSSSVTLTNNTQPAAVAVSTAGTYCNNTSLSATGGAPGTIYWENTTSGGTSTVLGSTPQTVSATGTYYYGSNNGGCWTYGSAAVIINTAPATPGAIAGTITQCPAQAGQVYSISAVASATTYTWSVPAGWTITAGAGTTSITVTTGTLGQNGNVSVTAGNACGTSTASSLAVTVVTTPATPGAITGTTAQCASYTGQVYSISAVTYATTYTWSVPAGWTITAGSGTTSITVTTGTAGQNGNITVTAGNSCGTSTSSSLAVTSATCIPPAPVASAATTTDCNSFIANWAASTGATSYYLDVSTSNIFTTFVTGFNNLSVGNNTSWYVGGLTAGTTYYYRVRASNSFGTSGNSNVISTGALPTTGCSSNLTWQKVGSAAGGAGVTAGDPVCGSDHTLSTGDYEVSAMCNDYKDNVLFVGGYFTTLNNSSITSADIGTWTPSAVYPYTSGTWASIGNVAGGVITVSGCGGNNPNEVLAMAYISGVVYIGGNFTTINGSSTDGAGHSYNNLAKYTISTATWSAIGNGGVTGGSNIGNAYNYASGNTYGGGFPIQAISVDPSGNVYVGGNFTTVAGTSGFNNIAMWNGATWSTVGGGVSGANSNGSGTGFSGANYLGPTSPSVYAIDAVDATHIYVGGQFTSPGNNIAMWNGANWTSSTVGSTGIPQNAYYNGGCAANSNIDIGYSYSLCPVVQSIANSGSLVYVGGIFSKAGAVSTTNIALWNQGTSAWSSIGGVCYQTNDQAEVTALYVNNGILYVGGDFQCQDQNCSDDNGNIEAYDGWMDLPAAHPGFVGGISNVLSIATLTNFPTPGYSILYAGGDFPSTAAGNATNQIAQYAGLTVPLPISLIFFNAQYNEDETAVDLNWVTASEKNNKEFTIEKSIDGENWTYVTTVAGAGNSSTEINYSAIDVSPYGGISYYRLKQTDFDGNCTYSTIRKVRINAVENKMAIFPDPASGNVNITFSCPDYANAQINIFDCTGRLVYTSQINAVKGINNNQFNVSGYTNGVYFVTVTTSLKQYQGKLVISH